MTEKIGPKWFIQCGGGGNLVEKHNSCSSADDISLGIIQAGATTFKLMAKFSFHIHPCKSTDINGEAWLSGREEFFP